MNYIKTGVLLLVLTLILVWIGSALGGPRGAMIAFVIALVMNGVSYWFSDKIVLAMYKAKELPEGQFHHLYSLVRGLTETAHLPMPKIFMTENKSANAFATGRDPSHAALCVTKGLLELLDENELKGVLAHELAHSLVSQPDYEIDEKAADALAQQWGFGVELNALRVEQEGAAQGGVTGRAVTQGRAMAQIIEPCTVLLDSAGSPQERALLRFVRQLYRHRVDGLLVDVPD